MHDLRIYCASFNANVFFFHDSSGLEADCVIVDKHGAWGLIEIKLSAADVEEGIATLNKVDDKIDKTIIGKPRFKMVITGSGYSHRRQDGTIVCPIGCLMP